MAGAGWPLEELASQRGAVKAPSCCCLVAAAERGQLLVEERWPRSSVPPLWKALRPQRGTSQAPGEQLTLPPGAGMAILVQDAMPQQLRATHRHWGRVGFAAALAALPRAIPRSTTATHRARKLAAATKESQRGCHLRAQHGTQTGREEKGCALS